jgi:hypothetical protein
MKNKALTAAQIEKMYQAGLLSDFEYQDLKEKFFRRMIRKGELK